MDFWLLAGGDDGDYIRVCLAALSKIFVMQDDVFHGTFFWAEFSLVGVVDMAVAATLTSCWRHAFCLKYTVRANIG